MIDLLSCFGNHSHLIWLKVEFRKDLAWWVEFFGQWNGISFFLFPTLEPLPDFSVSSDVSGSIGYGALWTMNGSMVDGVLFKFHCPLLTRSFFRLF